MGLDLATGDSLAVIVCPEDVADFGTIVIGEVWHLDVLSALRVSQDDEHVTK